VTLRWSIQVGEVGAQPWLAEDALRPLPAASVGKLLLLGCAAEMFADGSLSREEALSRRDAPFARDCGIWHTLHQDELPAVDVARLIGLVSDNLATNVLLRRIGLDQVGVWARRLTLTPLHLLDYVRDSRVGLDPSTPPMLSSANAERLFYFMELLAAGTVSNEVAEWLSLNTDLSMVADAFGLDPLAHNGIGAPVSGGITLVNKTGTDVGVRADVGLVHAGATRTAYAVMANWDEDEDGDCTSEVITRMREIGGQIRARL